jgi:hypothetical protein
MNRKRTKKPYWEMTAAELQKATQEFDEEFVADKARPLSPEMKAKWERARLKSPDLKNGARPRTISVRLDGTLLSRCTALAKKKRISRDALIARSLRTLLAKEE